MKFLSCMDEIKKEAGARAKVLADRNQYDRQLDRWKRSKAKEAGLTFEEYVERSEKQRRWAAANPSYHATYLKNYRASEKGKQVFKAANRRSQEKKRSAIVKMKSNPCVDCGGRFHSDAMEFDHRDNEEKVFLISSFGRRVSVERVLQEIAKCDLVCANCHRVRTAKRRLGLPIAVVEPEYFI